MLRGTAQHTLKRAGIDPVIPDEIKQVLIRQSYRTGNEHCASAWRHIAECEECCAALYLVAVMPELAARQQWWELPEL